MMKVVLCAVALSVFSCLPAVSQERLVGGKTKWVRRLTLISACAASFWDVQTTSAGVARGLSEGNSLFAGSQGKPRWGRMIGIKAALCGGSAVAQETPFIQHKLPDPAWIALNSALTGVFVKTALHNRAVTSQAIQNQAAAPAYLLVTK
jgi:hypothetical protein